MARIVLGLGSSHGPQLHVPPQMWAYFAERDRKNPGLLGKDGKFRPYDELVAAAPASMAAEITPEKWRERHAATQEGIARVSRKLAEVSPDVLVMVGDDERELFNDENTPAFMVYWGQTVPNVIRKVPDTADAPARAGAWAYGEADAEYPGSPELGEHIVKWMIANRFDVSHSAHLGTGKGIGHAFGFGFRRIMDGKIVPSLPIVMNASFPPNVPTAKRTYDFGMALRRAIESWPTDARVAVLALGGLSHQVIDEELDRRMLTAMQEKDMPTLRALPRERLKGMAGQTRTWLATAGAVEHLTMDLYAYIPCYRSPAGTGCAMAFAHWD